MNRRYAIILVPLVYLIPGCPGAGNNLVGVWTVMAFNANIGLTINANGTADSFAIPPDSDMFPAPLTWDVHGQQFFLHQGEGTFANTYVGRILSDTSMDGVWIEWGQTGVADTGSWTAAKQ